MEDHRKHDNSIKKKNSKSMPVAIQICGSFGIVLFGGALAVATVVSAATLIAFKTRRQHRRRSISKDTHTPDAIPNDNELLLKSHQDLSHVHNPSDGVTSNNKEIETKNIQTFTLVDQNHNDEQVESGHSNEESMCSVGGEDEENILIYVDSVFESSQIEDSYEKLIVGCEEQVVMATPIECSEILENGEMLIINNEHVNEEIEGDIDIVEYVKARDVIPIEDDHLLIGDDVVEASVIKNTTIEGASVNEVKVVKFLEEEKQIDDMIPLNYCEGSEIHQQMQCNNKQVVMEEEEEAAACVHVVGMEEIHVNEGRETTPSQLMNEEEVVQERVTIEEEIWNKKEKEILHAQVTEADKVDDNKTVAVEREDNPPTSKQEKVEYEIPVIEEEDVNEVSSKELQDSSMEEELTREAKKSNQHDHIYNSTSIKEDTGIKSEPWNLKRWSWSILVLIWCLCHWYSDLPYRELSLVASFFFFIIILILSI